MGAQEQGAEEAGRWTTIPRVLCFVFNGNDVLMMKRAPHRRIFPNRYNGLGGHIERNEDPYTAARREVREETGLDVRSLLLRGVHNIDAGYTTGIMIFVFTAWSVQREVIEDLDEGTLHWISRDELCNYDLVEDLPLILPRILKMDDADDPYFAHVSYDVNNRLRISFGTDEAWD